MSNIDADLSLQICSKLTQISEECFVDLSKVSAVVLRGSLYLIMDGVEYQVEMDYKTLLDKISKYRVLTQISERCFVDLNKASVVVINGKSNDVKVVSIRIEDTDFYVGLDYGAEFFTLLKSKELFDFL